MYLDRLLTNSAMALMIATVISATPAAAQSWPDNKLVVYFGLQGGYVEQEPGGVFQKFANPAHPDPLPLDLSALDGKGSLFGIHVGFDVSLPGILPPEVFIGIVGEYARANPGEELTIENRSNSGKLTRTYTIENDLNRIASVRARLGYKTGALAVFGTLGWSWADYEFTATSSCANATASTCANNRWSSQPRTDRAAVTADQDGLAYGGGLTYDINDRLRLTVEYVHHDVGGTAAMDQLAPFGAAQGKGVTIVDFDAIDVVQVKVSFRLD